MTPLQGRALHALQSHGAGTVNEVARQLHGVAESSVARALAALVALKCAAMRVGPRADGGTGRTIYRLKPHGRRELERWLAGHDMLGAVTLSRMRFEQHCKARGFNTERRTDGSYVFDPAALAWVTWRTALGLA